MFSQSRPFPIPLPWKLAIALLIAVGVAFRFINLDGKVFWHDEVYTVVRATGYNRQEIDAALFQNQLVSVAELQQFQTFKPGGTAADTVASLRIENPHHPPLYSLLTRGWMQQFGTSITAARSLAALLSLLALPAMYGLAMALFESRLAALWATALLAVSPFDVLFAQTARQYSLLTGLTIISGWMLLRALKRMDWPSWLVYGLVNAVGLYTQPFHLLAMVPQGIYVLLRQFYIPPAQVRMGRARRPLVRPLPGFIGAIALTLLMFLPWAWVLINNLDRVASATTWTRYSPGFGALVRLWMLSFTSLFLDLDLGFDNPLTYLVRSPILILIGLALYTLVRRTHPAVWLFVLLSAFVPFILLAIPDLVFGGRRSAISRYLIACYPSMQLAMGFWLAQQMPFTPINRLRKPQPWRIGMIGLLLAGSIASLAVSAISNTWWSKDLSYFNAGIAERINGLSSPIVVSDFGDEYTNTGDLISLSYEVTNSAQFLLVTQPPDLEAIAQNWNSETLLFRPSGPLRIALENNGWTINLLYPEGNLWTLDRE
ncbi:MAG: glycosyltransferase family 39 protein [Kaiparowitsia implicata GSE-PSE-MK54-09C]|jgi:uncharacterized membrane protein|nr:glycosyltransferase family 39 protein [Kaiparowitsia implicata GSE-PSE-MK54-09C]